MNLEEFLAELEIEQRTMQQWLERGWIVPSSPTSESEISDIDAARAVFIHELQSDFGVNDEGVDIVLHLVDQLHGLRRVLFSLQIDLHTSNDRGPGPSGPRLP